MERKAVTKNEYSQPILRLYTLPPDDVITTSNFDDNTAVDKWTYWGEGEFFN